MSDVYQRVVKNGFIEIPARHAALEVAVISDGSATTYSQVDSDGVVQVSECDGDKVNVLVPSDADFEEAL